MRTIASGLIAVLAVLIAMSAPTRADIWPAKPIHIVVTFAPGGAADIWARIIASIVGGALARASWSRTAVVAAASSRRRRWRAPIPTAPRS